MDIILWRSYTGVIEDVHIILSQNIIFYYTETVYKLIYINNKIIIYI